MVKKKKEKAEAVPEEVTRKHGKTGVMAKIAAIDAKCKEVDAAARQQIANIKAQAKENADAVAKMNTGIKEIITSIKDKAKGFGAYTKDFYYG